MRYGVRNKFFVMFMMPVVLIKESVKQIRELKRPDAPVYGERRQLTGKIPLIKYDPSMLISRLPQARKTRCLH